MRGLRKPFYDGGEIQVYQGDALSVLDELLSLWRRT